MNNYTLTNKELSALKSALMRAKKKGAGAVRDEVVKAWRIFEAKDYPDCWSDWQRADDDAQLEINRRPGI